MKKSCNHEGEGTPYCPQCGAGIGTPGTELLEHIRKTIASMKTKLEQCETMFRQSKTGNDEGHKSYLQRRCEHTARAVEKWHAWEYWVKNGIARDAGNAE